MQSTDFQDASNRCKREIQGPKCCPKKGANSKAGWVLQSGLDVVGDL